MAKVIGRLAPHGRSKYPWDDWFDGQVWELTPGEDFTVTIESFRSTAIGKASSLGGILRTRVAGGKLQLQYEALVDLDA